MNTICCIYDQVAERYLDPFTGPTIQFCIREFARAANKPGHQFNEFPEDYILFHIGNYDSESGVIHPETPRALGSASKFLESAPAPSFNPED